MNKLLINIFLVFLMAVNISFAKIVTDDPIEQAAIEALLKDAKLGWNEIKLTKNLIVEGRRNGILLVHRKGRDKRWKITNISDKRIYFDIKGNVIAINLNNTKFKNLSLINSFKSLIHFSCKCRSLKEFKKIEGLVSLEGLDFHLSKITKIGVLKNLPKLILLDLERTYISKIENLDGIPSLKFLMLKGTDIRKLEGLDSLINLEVLSLDASNDSDRKIIKIENIGNLENLKKLEIRFHKVEKLEGLETLVSLEDLTLLDYPQSSAIFR